MHPERGVGLVVEQAVTGMDDFQPVLPGPRRAVAAQARAGDELRDLGGTKMEETQHQRRLRVVAERHAQHRAEAKPALDRFHPAFDLRGHARLQQPDRRQSRAVFVLTRQLQP